MNLCEPLLTLQQLNDKVYLSVRNRPRKQWNLGISQWDPTMGQTYFLFEFQSLSRVQIYTKKYPLSYPVPMGTSATCSSCIIISQDPSIDILSIPQGSIERNPFYGRTLDQYLIFAPFSYSHAYAVIQHLNHSRISLEIVRL